MANTAEKMCIRDSPHTGADAQNPLGLTVHHLSQTRHSAVCCSLSPHGGDCIEVFLNFLFQRCADPYNTESLFRFNAVFHLCFSLNTDSKADPLVGFQAGPLLLGCGWGNPVYGSEGPVEGCRRFIPIPVSYTHLWNQERNYVTIASKQKAIDRLEATLEKPEAEPESIKFQFHASRRSGNDVLTAEDLSLSFDGGEPLFRNVNLEIKRGEKIFLIGPNGCGKTSLFKILLGQYRPDDGFVRLGAGIDLGYYEQSQLSLDDSKTVIDEIWDLHPRMSQTLSLIHI